MRPAAFVAYVVTLSVLAACAPMAAQEDSGMEHWVEHAGLKLYLLTGCEFCKWS